MLIEANLVDHIVILYNLEYDKRKLTNQSLPF